MNINEMKHSLELDNAQNHAKKLCIYHNINWSQQTFHNFSFHDLPTDFRSKEGKQLKKLCPTVYDVKQLKLFTKKLTKLVLLQSNQTVFLQTQLHTNTPSVNVENPPQCISCPQNVLNKIGYTVLSWWIRKSLVEKGTGVYLEKKWKNDVDPITLTDFKMLPKPFLYTYTDSQNHTYAFDIRTLYMMIQKKMHYNPFTKQSLSKKNIEHIRTRAQHLRELGFNLQIEGEDTKENNAKLCKQSIQQLVLNISQALDYMGYHVTVEMFMQLPSKELLHWYLSCEDIWNYRSQLTEQNKSNIVPHGNVFPYKGTIASYRNRLLKLQKIVFDTMLTLITSGVSESEKQTGAIYVISALTESSGVFLDAFQWLHQPP